MMSIRRKIIQALRCCCLSTGQDAAGVLGLVQLHPVFRFAQAAAGEALLPLSLSRLPKGGRLFSPSVPCSRPAHMPSRSR